MEITLNKKNNTEGLIKIKLSPGDYQPQVEEKMKEYARKANLKGFRQGKVPSGVIKRLFGKSILVDEINHILSHKLSDYIKDNNLRVIGEPLPDHEKANTIDWDTQQNFEFEYQIGMVEDFSYDLSNKVKVKSYPIEVGEKVIQETISDLKKRFGKVSHPEVSEPGDDLLGELQSPDGQFKKESVLIPSSKVAPAAQKAFTGLKKESEVEFEIDKTIADPDIVSQLLDLSVDEAKKVKGKYLFKVAHISRAEPAQMNQEFFDRVFGKETVTSEDEFINKVKETIGGNYNRESEHFLEHYIEDHFISNTKIDLPETFLKNWLKITSKGEVTDEVIQKEFESYLRTLKWDLVKNRIAEDKRIKVESEEVKARAKELIVSQFGGPSIAEQLKDKLDSIADNYLSHENGQNFMRLYNQLRNDKILKLIKENITVVENKVSLEEFKKIVDEHKH